MYVDGSTLVLTGRRYDDLLVEEETFDTYLGLSRNTVDGRTSLRGTTVNGSAVMRNGDFRDRAYLGQFEATGSLDLSGSVFADDCYVRCSRFGGRFQGESIHVDGALAFAHTTMPRTYLQDADIGTLSLENVTTDHIDLRGASIDELVVDEFDRYRFAVDADTDIAAVTVTGDTPMLGPVEERLVKKLVDRNMPWLDRQGCAFRVDDLTDIVMDDVYTGAFHSLRGKGVIADLDDNYYLARSDVL